MKKIKYLFLLAALGLSVSCAKETKELFDKSAEERLNEALTEYLDILTAAPNGWVLQYYPNSTQAYGGFIYLLDFDRDGSVTVATEIADPTDTEKSLFEMLLSQGPVISFNTYNPLLHYFSDPGIQGGEGTGYGYSGDYEFVFQNVTTDQIILKGLKTGNKMTLTRLDESVTWEDYLNDLVTFKSSINDYLFSYYSLMAGETEVTKMTEGNFPIFTYLAPGETNPYNTSSVAFIYTTTGISLFSPIEINGGQVQNFTWNEQNEIFVCDENSNVTLQGKYIDGFIHYNDFIGTWKFFAKYGTASTHTEYPVTITENVRNSSFTLTGLRYPITLRYNRSSSTLEILPQVPGTYTTGGNTFNVLLYASPQPGSLNTTQTAGIITEIDENNPNKFSWVDNGVLGSITGIGMYYINGGYYSLATYYVCYMVKQP